MQEYDVKRGQSKDMDALARIIEGVFGNVKKEGDTLTASYGAIKKLTVTPRGKTSLVVDTQMDPTVPNDVAGETIACYNRFLQEATGFTSKERKKRLNKKAKEGKL